jgi:hypothetical protein
MKKLNEKYDKNKEKLPTKTCEKVTFLWKKGIRR